MAKELITKKLTDVMTGSLAGGKVLGVTSSGDLAQSPKEEYILKSEKGTANGVATLDAQGKLVQGIDESTLVKKTDVGVSVAPLATGKLPNVNINFGSVSDGNANVVSGGEVYKFVESENKALGISFISNTSPLYDLWHNINISDSTKWNDGRLRSNGQIDNLGAMFHNKERQAIKAGTYRTNLFMSTSVSTMLFFNSAGVFISQITGVRGSANLDFWELVVPENTAFFSLSLQRVTGAFNFNGKTFDIYYSTPQPQLGNSVFQLKAELKNGVFSSLGIVTIPLGTEFISSYIGSSVTNTNLWSAGFLTATGGVDLSARWYHTKDYIALPAGKFRFKLFFSSSARFIIYNKDRSIREVLEGGSNDSNALKDFTMVTDGYIRFSHREDANPDIHRLDSIYIINTADIVPTIISSYNIDSFLPPESGGVIRKTFLNTYRPKKRRPIVTLISDDGARENDSWYIPMLNEFGVKSTFAIVGNWTRRVDLGQSTAHLSSKRLREMFVDGHDIASHTWTHTQNWNTALTLEQIEEEMSRNKVFLQNITTTDVNMFISPYGIRSAPIDNIISKYYDANFISGYGSVNNVPLDNYLLNRVSFDSSETTFDLRWETILKPAIDEAVVTNNWLVLAVHPQYVQYSATNPQYMDRRNELRTLLQYCRDNNIEIATAKKGYDYYRNFVNIGVRRVDSKVYQLGMDGTEYNLNYFSE